MCFSLGRGHRTGRGTSPRDTYALGFSSSTFSNVSVFTGNHQLPALRETFFLDLLCLVSPVSWKTVTFLPSDFILSWSPL